jgi:hypothetical protein
VVIDELPLPRRVYVSTPRYRGKCDDVADAREPVQFQPHANVGSVTTSPKMPTSRSYFNHTQAREMRPGVAERTNPDNVSTTRTRVKCDVNKCRVVGYRPFQPHVTAGNLYARNPFNPT